MTSSRVWFQLVAYKSQLYAIGGFDGSDDTNSVENYVSDTNTWYPSLKSLNKIREAMGAAVIDNSIYVCGGFDTKPGEFQGQYLNDCEYYTTNTKQWYLSIPMLSRRAHLALVAQGQLLYALGGRDNGSELATGERYDTGSQQWQPIASMLTKRAEFGAVSYKDKLYVCGGSVAFGSYTNQCEAYDPVADKWTKIGSLSEKRKSLQLIVYNERLYALGGYPLTNTVEIYDLEANEWQFSQPFPYKVQAFGV
ncbi:kelch-like protein 18 [Oppia nitens]|uniref:kelch-like protein 18 n=1 Tax=Oppia nitens TaxID=1686743 RepID=UPI0023DB3F83|nr:kelch-like protein 18 [Oppia nitens]